jgi:peptide-methionine (S)-S-oxide reductase
MLDYALFAGGCFWGVEAAFRATSGVAFTKVGYAGGNTVDPTYKDVCRDLTGHAETVLVVYDPAIISYKALLETYFTINEGSCGCDELGSFGSQYRSIIFYNNAEQKKVAGDLIKFLDRSHVYESPITTDLVMTKNFYLAEDYHQQYYEKHGLVDLTC